MRSPLRLPAFRLVLLAATLAAACRGERPAPPRADSGPARGGTAVIGYVADVENWNPYLVDTAFSEDVLSLMYPTLLIEQVDYQEHPPSFAPHLATAWEASADGLSVTFHLRPEARWSDGVPVTAEDVVFSWRAQTSPEVGWSGIGIKDFVTGVEALDEHTVRFTFDHAYPYQVMDANDSAIVPAHAWRDIPFAEWERTDWSRHALSAGPFVLERSAPHEEIVLARNPHYFKPGLPYLDRVVWRITADHSALLTQLLAGDLDVLPAVPPEDAGRVAADPDLELVRFPDRVYGFIAWNTLHPLFSDERVRRAMTLAIDREEIVDTVLHGAARPSIGPVLSTMWAFNRALEPLPYEPAAARALLEEAGFVDADGDGVRERDGRPLRFELLTVAGNQTRADIALLVQQDLARVGARVEPRAMEWGTLASRLEGGEFAAWIGAWREGTQIDLESIWASPEPGVPTFNYVGWGHPEADRLMAEASAMADAAAQKPLLDRVQEIIVSSQPYTFLYEGDRLAGFDRRLGGVEINDATPYFSIDQWHVVPPGAR